VAWLGGRLISAGHYENGELDGTVVIWETTGRKLQMVDYEHGEPRVSVGWDDAGMQTHEEVWQPGSTHSEVRMWHRSGELRSVVGTDGVNLNGLYEYWHESGKLGARGRYDSGRRVGLWTCWDETGNESISFEHDASGKLVSGVSKESEVPEWARRCTDTCRGGESPAASPTGCGQPRN
jgi:antitoxin component YwqK of YwqJK toxin-antitoxin module